MNEEAFCFKNLVINTYPHVNVTVSPSVPIQVASFVATALRRGTYKIVSELWVDEKKIHFLEFDINVSTCTMHLSPCFHSHYRNFIALLGCFGIL